jgi:hypothetical protein
MGHKMIDYCELAVYQRGTFLYWVMYPVLHSIYPIYSAHGRVVWLLSNIYTNYDDAFTPPDLWLSVN